VRTCFSIAARTQCEPRGVLPDLDFNSRHHDDQSLGLLADAQPECESDEIIAFVPSKQPIQQPPCHLSSHITAEEPLLVCSVLCQCQALSSFCQARHEICIPSSELIECRLTASALELDVHMSISSSLCMQVNKASCFHNVIVRYAHNTRPQTSRIFLPTIGRHGVVADGR
jgi:hypothetical protein